MQSILLWACNQGNFKCCEGVIFVFALFSHRSKSALQVHHVGSNIFLKRAVGRQH